MFVLDPRSSTLEAACDTVFVGVLLFHHTLHSVSDLSFFLPVPSFL